MSRLATPLVTALATPLASPLTGLVLVAPPGAPTIGTATQTGATTATVSFTPPASDGGSAITGYRVTSSPGGITATGGSSPITVTGLTPNTNYTFTVQAQNAQGLGAASAASNQITTQPLLADPLSNTTFSTGGADVGCGVRFDTDGRYYTIVNFSVTGPYNFGQTPTPPNAIYGTAGFEIRATRVSGAAVDTTNSTLVNAAWTAFNSNRVFYLNGAGSFTIELRHSSNPGMVLRTYTFSMT